MGKGYGFHKLSILYGPKPKKHELSILYGPKPKKHEFEAISYVKFYWLNPYLLIKIPIMSSNLYLYCWFCGFWSI